MTNTSRTTLVRLLMWHLNEGRLDLDNGVWGIPHMYAEGVGWA